MTENMLFTKDKMCFKFCNTCYSKIPCLLYVTSDGRGKTPLSPVATSAPQSPFGSSNIQLVESSLYPSTSSVMHSYSSGSLGQIHYDNASMSSMWPHRGKLQSRRSQSREDLASTLTEPH